MSLKKSSIDDLTLIFPLIAKKNIKPDVRIIDGLLQYITKILYCVINHISVISRLIRAI